jgi:hypothetical protein
VAAAWRNICGCTPTLMPTSSARRLIMACTDLVLILCPLLFPRAKKPWIFKHDTQPRYWVLAGWLATRQTPFKHTAQIMTGLQKMCGCCVAQHMWVHTNLNANFQCTPLLRAFCEWWARGQKCGTRH